MKLKTFLLTGLLLLGTITTKAQEKQVQIDSNTKESITKENLSETPDFSGSVDVKFVEKIGQIGNRMIIILNLLFPIFRV